MNKFNKLLKNPGTIIILVTILLGIILILICWNLFEYDKLLSNILLSVGCSLIASGIVTFISSVFLLSSNEIKDMISLWQIKSIYKTKSEMNSKANNYLENAKTKIDIIAIGMTNYISARGDVLKEKSQNGVKIRIISCKSNEMLLQREKDEAVNITRNPTGKLKEEVLDLYKWVDNLKFAGCDISLRFHDTYPGFSYLRIDDHIFWGPNLPLKKSQQNIAFEFYLNGEGGASFSQYFEKIWNDDNFCHENIE